MPVSRSLLVFRAAVARWPSPPPSRRTRPFRARCPRGTRRSLSAARMRKPSAHAHAEEGRRGRAPATGRAPRARGPQPGGHGGGGGHRACAEVRTAAPSAVTNRRVALLRAC